MAYAESTIGGSAGGSFRVWVNSIRTYDGNQSDNFEDWRVEGGLNRVSGSGGTIYNNYNQASYTLQLGMNGVASSGRFNYTFNTATGTKVAWGTGTTRVYRDSAGNGFGFQSRMDINLSNSPYLTSGWVTSNDNVQTRPRYAVLTALSMDSGGIPATDEGPMWLEFYNPSGTTVQAFIDGPAGRVYTSGNTGSRHDVAWTTALTEALQQQSINSNTANMNIGIVDGFGHYDYRGRTYTIKNDVGQANPVFTDFTFKDTNSSTVAITGDDQAVIQGKSDLDATITVANKATPLKFATMSYYTATLGSSSSQAPYSPSSNVVIPIDVTDVADATAISVQAVDSRGNNATVSKPVIVLPYSSPALSPAFAIRYTNDYNSANGLTIELPESVLATISPLTLGGVDKNAIVGSSGMTFDISKGDTTSYTGDPVDIVTVQTSGTGEITTDVEDLENAILAKMGSLIADNTVPWYLKFSITDKLETKTFEYRIDIGRSIFRIGTDRKVYNNEDQLLNIPMISTLSDSLLAPNSDGFTFEYYPWAEVMNRKLYINYGSGVGNSSTVVFNVSFSCFVDTAAQYAWTLYIDGVPVGNTSRKFFINQTGSHTTVSGTVVARGLSAGAHYVDIAIDGQGNTLSTDQNDYLSLVATEYVNSYVPYEVGPNYAGTVVDGGGGGQVWSNPGNAAGVENGTVAQVSEGQTYGTPNQLISSGHGFNIPSEARIIGIEVEAFTNSTDGVPVYDNAISIGIPGKTSVGEPEFFGNYWGGGGRWITWGGYGSLWGRTDWYPSDINDPNFGASISPFALVDDSIDTVDAIRINVYYI